MKNSNKIIDVGNKANISIIILKLVFNSIIFYVEEDILMYTMYSGE